MQFAIASQGLHDEMMQAFTNPKLSSKAQPMKGLNQQLPNPMQSRMHCPMPESKRQALKN